MLRYNILESLTFFVDKKLQKEKPNEKLCFPELLDWLMKNAIIDFTSARNFCIRQEFKKMQATTELSNNKIIQELSITFEVSESLIKSIL